MLTSYPRPTSIRPNSVSIPSASPSRRRWAIAMIRFIFTLATLTALLSCGRQESKQAPAPAPDVWAQEAGAFYDSYEGAAVGRKFTFTGVQQDKIESLVPDLMGRGFHKVEPGTEEDKPGSLT